MAMQVEIPGSPTPTEIDTLFFWTGSCSSFSTKQEQMIWREAGIIDIMIESIVSSPASYSLREWQSPPKAFLKKK